MTELERLATVRYEADVRNDKLRRLNVKREIQA